MKRLLSFVLVLSVIISILPAVPIATAGETENVIKYNFTVSALSESDTSFGYSSLKTKTMTDVRTEVSAPWKWAGFTYTHNLYSNAAGIQMNIAKNRASGASFVVLELDVKNGGEYVPSLVYKTDGGAPKADVYLIKNVDTIDDFSVETTGGEGNAAISQYVGKWQNGEVGGYQLADDAVFSATEETTVTFDECTLDSDSTYYLIFNFVGYEGEVTDYIYYYAKNFTLTDPDYIVADELESIELSSNATTIVVGSEMTLSANGIYTVSGKKPLTEGIEYTSSDEDIATVSAGGRVKGIAKGTARITATLSGTDMSAYIDVTVTEKPRATREYKYMFDRNAYGTTASNVSWTQLAEKTTDDVVNGDAWRGAGTFYINNLYANDEGLYLNAGSGRADSGVAYLAFEFELNEAGTFIPIISYNAAPSAPIVDIYLVKKAENTPAFIFTSNTTGSINLHNYVIGLDDGYKLANLDMFAETKTEKKLILPEREILEKGTYYLIFRTVGKNKNFIAASSNLLEMTIRSFSMKPPAGDFDKITLSVDNLINESDPMPNMTQRQLEYKLYDDVGIEIDEIDTEKLSVTFSSDNENIASVSETGLITAVSNGEVTLRADVTYDGITRSARFNLVVEPAGRNLMEGLNADFEADEWVWDTANETNTEAGKQLQRTTIGVMEKDGNADNRALAVSFDPEYTGMSGPPSISLKNDGHRVAVVPGKLYQLTFKVKDDSVWADNASHLSMLFDIYSYINPTGTSSSALALANNRNMNYALSDACKENHGKWVEVSVPVAAPFEHEQDIIYITPRLDFRTATDDKGKAGFGGTIWIDDFELREVGYAGVEVEVTGALDSGTQSDVTIITKPYTTLGSYISIGSEWSPDRFLKVSSGNEYVVGSIGDTARTQTVTSSGMFFMNTAAKTNGMNGNTDITSSMTIHGITRTGTTTVTTSRFALGLLYAEAKASSPTIAAGDKTAVTPTGYLSDGTVADLNNATIFYQTSTPDIVSVDKTTGEVIGLRAGTGKINVSVNLDGRIASDVVEIKVTDSTPIVTATLCGPDTVGYLRDEQLTITGVTEGGYAADISASDVRWVISNEAAVSVDKKYLVFGKTLGETAKVKAFVTLNGATVETNEITVKVTKTDLRDHLIDFRKATVSRPKDATLKSDGWQLNLAESAAPVASARLSTDGMPIETSAVGQKVVLDVDIPYTGVYQIILTGYLNNYNTPLADVYLDGIYVGDYVFYEEGRNSATEPERMRTLSLESGKHTFTLIPVETGKNNENMILQEIRFKAREEMPEIKAVMAARNEYAVEMESTAKIAAEVLTSDGNFYNGSPMLSGKNDPIITVSYTSHDTSIATVNADGTINAVKPGKTKITVVATDGSTSAETTVDVVVYEKGGTFAGEFSKAEIVSDSFVMSLKTEGIKLSVKGFDDAGNVLDLSDATISWESSDESIATVDATGKVTPVSIGTADITATVTLGDITVTGTRTVSVRAGKTGRTYYTDEMVAAARENAKKYSWAKNTVKSTVARADKYLGNLDMLYEMIPGEGIPRSTTVGYRNDPDRFYCKYCGEDLYTKHGMYPWVTNVLQRPWKVQCPDCKRLFPTNDFEKLYELGRDEHGVYNEALALERNAELVANGEKGYAVNVLYPEIGTENHPDTVRFSSWETTEGWGVDTGKGYDTGRICSNGVKEVHTYLAYIMHCGIWYNVMGNGAKGELHSAVKDLSQAYLYTGDEKYGRAGAILIDRIADVYPGYNLRLYSLDYANSDGGAKRGKVLGSIWEIGIQHDFSAAYDAVFPMYDDPQVISYLREKAGKFNLDNDKSDPEKIRTNIETGLLREIYETVCTGDSHGNFGMHQSALAAAAVTLDTQPETNEMIDWIFRYSELTSTSNTGGEVNQRLINEVSRDGQGTESSPTYNRGWINNLTDAAAILARYPEYDGMDIYGNPKYIGMLQSYPYMTILRRGVPQIGDSGSYAGYGLLPDDDQIMVDGFKYTREKNPEAAKEIAQHMYFVKDGNLDGIHYDIWTRNPESIADEVEEIIDTYGEWDYDKSTALTGYGLNILRGGTLYESNGTDVMRDTQRDFWIYYGGAKSHRKNDTLTLGVDAYGISISSGLGYPEDTGSDPNRVQWQNATLSHNTVVVNEQNLNRSAYTPKTLHFDAKKDSRVKLMDIDVPGAYTATDEYRRTVVMIDYDDEISYGIDFFRVLGGDDHLYSFHVSSQDNPLHSDNLNFNHQETGTYAGIDVPYGKDPYTTTSAYTILKYPNGYTWLDDIHRADKPENSEFWLDYKITDFRKLSRNGKMDVRLRMTMVNDWIADEVTLANGMPPRTKETLAVLDHIEYMLVRRKGRDLDTLFTTVIEPYNGSRYIKHIEGIPVTVVEGTPDKNDSVKALKVELIDGRCDYIVYAQNNAVTYNVGDVFRFRGFVGVWTVAENGENIYSYVSDGEIIGNDSYIREGLDSKLEGTVVDFQRELSFDNWVEVEFDREVTPEEADSLADRLVNFEHKGVGNASFIIKGVTMTSATRGIIDFGGITLINSYVDAKNEELGYKYDVDVGKTFEIPLSYEENAAPVFDEVSENFSTSAGSSISVKVNATAENNGEVTYSARTLPRGASFNAETGMFSWKPDASQIGESLVAIDAVDEYGRISTQFFTITVYGSTTSKPSDATENTETPSTGNAGSSGGGGGGGGGAAPTDKPDDEASTGETDKAEDGETSPETSGETDNIRFTDISNHAWAADAINSLADSGVIKGTSENTFSPANNITRADFALLLVRAFELEADNTENFADVSASDYFAPELAVARNYGIIRGVGDNRFAPRNTITRQDMMVIVYRALEASLALKGGGPSNDGGGILHSQYPDYDTVAAYAREAVSALVGAGLVNGKNGKIAPTDYTTRAEVAVLIKRILDFIK